MYKSKDRMGTVTATEWIRKEEKRSEGVTEH